MEAESTPTFGALLRRRRVASGLTQEALAERSGLSERAISDLERGVNRAPRRDSVRSLAEALGLTAAERADWEAACRRLAVRLVLPAAARRLREIPRDRTAPRHNLPLQLTSFVGREREVADVTRRIADGPDRMRLLTLTGTGGCGKTRLAL